jgi:ribosomal protein S18 acetylase RimI-like enzyme
MSPLAGAALSAHFDAEGWSRFDESLVMRMILTEASVDGALDQIPLKDIGRFIGASMKVHESDPSLRPGLSEIIGAIQPEAGLFALERGEDPLATLICVHDGDLAGLFEVATAREARQQGHGRNLILSALKWARLRGARQAWLQVEADNAPALALYGSLGFETVYPYHYRRPPGA